MNRYERFRTQELTEMSEEALKLPELAVTPLRELRSFPGVWLKCEHENPTGSHKDRAYRAMISSINGSLLGRKLVDYTTGNGGISLSWLSRELGVPAVTFMPEDMTTQRVRLIRHYGAELILTPANGFVAAARAAAEKYVRKHPEAILLSQSDNLANEWGFTRVGEEILMQFGSLALRPVAFVCAIGTGGSFSGIAQVLKAEFGDRSLPAIGIEVPESPIIWAKRRGETIHPASPSIIGMGAGKIARNTDERLIDDIKIVGAGDVLEVIENLNDIDGLDLGPSTAANILVAFRIARQLRGPVVTISFDRGDRYED